MPSFGEEYDTVKAEKADAMRRYNRKRIFTFCLRIAVALFLLCWSLKLIPNIERMAGSYFSILKQEFWVFMLINALIFLVYNLSTTTTNHNNEKNDFMSPQHDIYDQYVSHSTILSGRNAAVGPDEDKQLVVSKAAEIAPENNTFHDKEMVTCENAVYASVEENPVRDLAVVDHAYKDDNKQEKVYRRTQSERVGREKNDHCRRELRRSETEIGRELAVGTGRYNLDRKSVEEMNSEEFRLTIERFIAYRKKLLRDENIALVTAEKKQ